MRLRLVMRCTFDPSEVSIWGEGQRAAAEGVGVARQHDVRWNNLGQCVCKVFFSFVYVMSSLRIAFLSL